MLYKEQLEPILQKLKNQKKIVELGGDPFRNKNPQGYYTEAVLLSYLSTEIWRVEQALKTAKSVYLSH